MAKKRAYHDNFQPIVKVEPQAGNPRARENPDSYLQLKPTWQFQSFDWDGPWGLLAIKEKDWLKHIQQHLSKWESMTWAEILAQNGGRGVRGGNNHHPLDVDGFSKKARDRLAEIETFPDQLFSFRFDNCTRLYGIREINCLRIIWFDPFHCEKGQKSKAAYVTRS